MYVHVLSGLKWTTTPCTLDFHLVAVPRRCGVAEQLLLLFEFGDGQIWVMDPRYLLIRDVAKL